MSCNCCECCSKELDEGSRRCSSTKIEDSTSNEALSQCECNKCCKKVRGRFGLAWLVETPGCKYEEPTGWQIEYIDTPSRVFQKCQHMVSWVNSPPMDCSANQSSERYFPIPPTSKCPSAAEPEKCQCCEENSESESSDYCDCFEQGYNNNYSERHSDNFSCCCANSNHSTNNNGSSNRPLLCRCEDTRRSSNRKSSLKSKCCKNSSPNGSDSHRRSKSPIFGEEIYNGDRRNSKSSDKQKFKCCSCDNPIPKVEKCCKCKSVKIETSCNCANQTGSTTDSYEKLSKICSCSQQRPKVELPKCRCCCCNTENNNSKSLENTENELSNTNDKNMSTTDNSMKQLEPEPVEKAHSKRPKTQRRKNKT